MSAKDRRKVMVVGLAAGWRSTLRERARGGSLADAIRREVEAGLAGAVDLGTIDAMSLLPVQLPARCRLQIERIARDWQVSPAYVVQQILAARLGPLESRGKIGDKT